MPMERFCITMSEKDVDLFELERGKLGLTKSAFVRLLIAEHKNTVPGFIRNKEIIRELSELNNSIKSLLLKDSLNDTEKIHLFEEMKNTTRFVKELCAKLAQSDK